MIEENPWPIEVLVEIFKWFSIEERLLQLAAVCKLFYQAFHTYILAAVCKLFYQAFHTPKF